MTRPKLSPSQRLGKGHLPLWFCRLFLAQKDEDLRGTKRDMDTGEEYVCVVRFDMDDRERANGPPGAVISR